MKQYLAIDIGGTAVKLGIVDEEGRVLSRTEQSVCFDNYETPILTTVLSAAEQFLKEQAVEPQGLAGIGVSATGQVDDRAGVVIGTNGKIPGYEGSRIKEEMESRFHLPVWVLNDANAAVLHRAQEDPALNGMGTTVVVSIAAGGVLHIAHAGDSRCYLKTALGVKQVTTDHSFVQQLVESGAITEDEARVHPQRNLITRVVGVHPEVECDYGCYKFEPGDLALSCTDGLSNYLERDTLLLFISNYQGEELADELIRYANSKGGSDNVTVAVIENR